MFQNLIESGSHRKDLARRGRFLLGTLALYALLVAVAGVASVSAYNARLDAQTYEVTLLPPWALPATAQTNDRHDQPARAARSNADEVPMRRVLIADLRTTPPSTPPISTQASNAMTMPPGIVLIGPIDRNPISPGGVGPVGPVNVDAFPVNSNARPQIVVATPNDPPPPEDVRPTPHPTPRGPVQLSRLISSKVLSKPAPPYPSIAIAARVEGSVTVEILVDEQGRVVSATAKDGPVMLREAARQAAMLARFTPTRLNGEPVKVSGVISYNFTLR